MQSKKRTIFLIMAPPIVLCWLYSPFIIDYFTRYDRAFRKVLRYSDVATVRHKNLRPLIALVWFPDGKVNYGARLIIGEEGKVYLDQVYYNVASRGGGRESLRNQRDIEMINQLHELPIGLRSADVVPCNRIIIVSQKVHGNWVKRYYDREQLPQEVKKIIELSGLNNI